jgi:hypothetical protein
MKGAMLFDAALSAVFMLLGLFMLIRPDPVRRWFQARQPWGWARRGYDCRYANAFMRMFGLAFVVFGGWSGYDLLAPILKPLQ